MLKAKGKVMIEENKEKHASCNCCSGSKETPKLWDVRFTFGSQTTLIKLCEEHLKDLQQEINKQFT